MAVAIRHVQNPAMAITHAFVGVVVSDFAAAHEWYVRLFGREADMSPRDGEGVWRLSSSSSVYVVGDPERPGNGVLTLAVDDLVAYADRLRADGLALTEQSGGNAPHRLTISDDDGNTITFFQDPAPRWPNSPGPAVGNGLASVKGGRVSGEAD
jgi:catechol 2,3-dioxygenase-like lactoylglutathione lyase family enzyme